jgi:hypothetical protein
LHPTAHHDAVVKAKVDHRDVSVGNIIIVRSEYGMPGAGMLIDWEVSKYEEKEVRVYEKAVRMHSPTFYSIVHASSP